MTTAAAFLFPIQPPAIVKTLIMLQIVLLQIGTIREEVLRLPLGEQGPLLRALGKHERHAQRLLAAARRMAVSH